MFLYQEFLKWENDINPVPLSKGFVVYEYYEVMPKIEVISFFWENKKRRPNCYSFRYSKLIKTGKPGECYINHSCQEVSWDNFFDTWDVIKKNLLEKSNLYVAKTLTEAKHLIWKSFISTQEFLLYKYIDSFPSSFFNSLNVNLDYSVRVENQNSFILYIKNKLPSVYSSWISFFETNIDDFFCHWFHIYCQ